MTNEETTDQIKHRPSRKLAPKVSPVSVMENSRCGAVLVFKEGVSRAEAEAFLAEISGHMTATGKRYIDADYYFGGKPQVHEYDPAMGGPVWYIP